MRIHWLLPVSARARMSGRGTPEHECVASCTLCKPQVVGPSTVANAGASLRCAFGRSQSTDRWVGRRWRWRRSPAIGPTLSMRSRPHPANTSSSRKYLRRLRYRGDLDHQMDHENPSRQMSRCCDGLSGAIPGGAGQVQSILDEAPSRFVSAR
jgi:hypothetical protein